MSQFTYTSTVNELLELLDAYLQRPSMDGRADRQQMRANLMRLLEQAKQESGATEAKPLASADKP